MNSLPVLPQEIQPSTNPLINVFNAVIDGVNQLAVNARDLHSFLKVGRRFTTWIQSRIDEYKFAGNLDFISFSQNGEKPLGGRPTVEYHLTLDMAKELAMVENNEQGRKVRRYFIRCEKELYKSDSKHREILRQACEKLATGNMLVSDTYIMVGKHFGYEGGIKNIPTPLLPEAVAFVYEMILRLKSTEPKPAFDDSDKNNIAVLISHSFSLMRWYNHVKNPIMMLNPDLYTASAEHVGMIGMMARSLNKSLDLQVNEKYLLRV